jgi:hypothetical protein
MRYYNFLTLPNFLLCLSVNVLQTAAFTQLKVDIHLGKFLPRTGFTNDGEALGE